METVLSAALRQAAVEVADASAVGAARRLVNEIGRAAGLDETTLGEAALLATEAATNIVKHAGKGEILVRPLRSGAVPGIEILAIDSGPGMSNLGLSLRDGITTAGSYGIGLGTMQRAAHVFDIHSMPDKGTVIAMIVYGKGATLPPTAIEVGAVCLPMPGETVCGDAWAIAAGPTLISVMVADGLGHGPLAATASEAAAETLAANPACPPGTAMQDIDAALRHTRGAAVAVAQLDLLDERVQFAGVGNIMASLYDGTTRRQMVSHNGIVGNNARKIQEFVHDWHMGSLLILCSDGIGTRWDLSQYPGLARHHPAIIAGVLYRDFARRRDDATVLVIRERRE